MLIVDTYNVLHVVGVLPPEIAGIDTADLIGLIGRSRYRGRRVMLICDGVPPPGAPRGRTGSISVHYAGSGTTADDRIAAIIRRSSAPRRLTIVSSDRAILREGRRRRSATVDSAEFLRHLADDHRRAGPAPPASSASPEAASPAGSALPAVLPPELIAEAELLAEIGLVPEEPAGPPPEKDAPEAKPAQRGPPDHEPLGAGRTGLDLADLGLPGFDPADLAETAERNAAIPRDVLDEAETLWRAGAEEDEPDEGLA
jgi:predicted RNA-binding protein with PIN domain